MSPRRCLPLLLWVTLLTACDRESVFERRISPGAPVPLERVVVWPLQGRASLLTYAPADDRVQEVQLSDRPARVFRHPAGLGVLVLTADLQLSWIRIDDAGRAAAPRVYTLDAPFEAATFAPEGDLVVLHHGPPAPGADFALESAAELGDGLRNPNALLVVDLEADASETNPRRRDLRAFGSRPASVQILPRGSLAGESRRVVFVYAEGYVSLFDLAAPEAVDVVVRLGLAADALATATGAEVLPTGEGTKTSAILRASGTSDVFILSFESDGDPETSPRPVIAALPAGRGMTGLTVYATPRGPRVFTLGGGRLGVVDPETGARVEVVLPEPADSLFVHPERPGHALLWRSQGETLLHVDLDTLETERGRAVAAQRVGVRARALLATPGQARIVVSGDDGVAVVSLDDRALSTYEAGLGRSLGTVLPSFDGRFLVALSNAQYDGPASLLALDLENGATASVEVRGVGSLYAVPGAERFVGVGDEETGRVVFVSAEALVNRSPGALRVREHLFLEGLFER